MPYRIIYWKTVQDFQNGKESEWEEFETKMSLFKKFLNLKIQKPFIIYSILMKKAL